MFGLDDSEISDGRHDEVLQEPQLEGVARVRDVVTSASIVSLAATGVTKLLLSVFLGISG